MKITTATKVKDTCINNPLLPTDLFEFINTPISCIATTDIDDIEGSNPYSLRDIAKCSTLPYENIPPSGLLGDEHSNYTHVSRDTEASCHEIINGLFENSKDATNDIQRWPRVRNILCLKYEL